MPGPLHGIKVIDLTSVVSGPLATQTLADQGADVIKVEAPRGDHARHVATRRGGFSAAFLNNNRNKRSVVLNLKHPDGLSAFMRLVRDADAMVQNFRPGVAERIGVGEAAIREVNPEIVYVSIAGFGFDGPYANKPVFDPLVQAVSGLTTVQAGSDELETPSGAHDSSGQADRHPGLPGHYRRPAGARTLGQGPARAAVDARYRGVLSLELRHGRTHLRGSRERNRNAPSPGSTSSMKRRTATSPSP